LVARTAPQDAYTATRQAHWDELADASPEGSFFGRRYRKQLQAIYSFLIPPGQRVLEIGCGRGDLLAAVKPAQGVGLDLSAGMIDQARERHPHLTFIQGDAHSLPLAKPFDVVILSDLVNDLWDVEQVLHQLHGVLSPRGRVILNFHSNLWQFPAWLGRRLGLADRAQQQNWLTSEDVANLLNLTDFEVIRHWGEILLPARVPLLSGLCNRVLARVWPFRLAALTNFVASMNVTPLQLIYILFVFYVILGTFFETLPMMVGTLPLVQPLILAAGIDPVWFGVFLVLMCEISLISPPVGMTLYVIQAVRNEGSIGDVFRGTIPFFITMLLMTVLLIHFQELALWLPRKAFD
jgi:SAM-dependent methyltransferase